MTEEGWRVALTYKRQPEGPNMLERDVAPGVHRIEDAHTNWYLVEEQGRLSVVATGHPRSWNSLNSALHELSAGVSDIEAVVLTHAHFDHMGFANRTLGLGIPLLAHQREVSVVQHPWRYDHERSRLPYLRHPTFVQVLGEMTAMGALWVKGGTPTQTFESQNRLDVPGRPEVIFTPGHTHGHCALLFADRGVLLAGDAFVMLDPDSGRRGPCIVSGAATASSPEALESLEHIAGLDADVTGTGHGPVWRGSLRDAVDQARAAGPA